MSIANLQVTRRNFLAAISASSLMLMGKVGPGQEAGLIDPSQRDVDDFAPDFLWRFLPMELLPSSFIARKWELAFAPAYRIVADESRAIESSGDSTSNWR